MSKIRLAAALIIVFAVFAFVVPANAATQHVFDDEGLFTATEIDEMEAEIANIAEAYQLDVVIVCPTTLEGKSPMAYADDYYDYNGFGIGDDNSGLLLLISMEDRDIWISTTGQAINIFTDARISTMVSNVTGELSSGNFSKGAMQFLGDCSYYASVGPPSSSDDYAGGELYVRTHNYPLIIIVSLLIALAAGGGVAFFAARSYKTPKKQATGNYLDQNALHFTESTDRFVTSNISRTPIPKDNDGGGGSSTHTSSSGTSHGGGGGKF